MNRMHQGLIMGYEFVGRQEEKDKFQKILDAKKAAKYNIIGKPGVGKSSLMLEFIKMCDDKSIH